MASSPFLTSRLALLPLSFASLATAPSSTSSSASCSAARGALCTRNCAAAPIQPRKTTAAAAASPKSSTRNVVCVDGGGSDVRKGVHRYTSKFSGTPVPFTSVSAARTARPPASSRGNPGVSSSPRSALVQKVTANELDSILSAERTSPMIIDFYATWCGPCVLLAQELEQLAVEYGEDIRFLKVDTDEEHELASLMEIRGLPTLVFVNKDVDKLSIRTEGLLPTDAIRDIIEKEILV